MNQMIPMTQLSLTLPPPASAAPSPSHKEVILASLNECGKHFKGKHTFLSWSLKHFSLIHSPNSP